MASDATREASPRSIADSRVPQVALLTRTPLLPAALQDAAENDGTYVKDKFAHTRGRRKRTSREDHAILESEYQRNPRPDKGTRASIVGRVSLSEKEVQVWFQNRRQMTRRKCRTWQPNEITSIIRGSHDYDENPADNSSFGEADGLRLSHSFTSETSHVRGSLGSQPSPTSSEEPTSSPETAPDLASASFPMSRNTSDRDALDPSDPTHDSGSAKGVSASSVSVARPSSAGIAESGSLSRSLSSAVGERITLSATSQDKDGPSTLPARVDTKRSGIKRTASLARLSTSIDGKAEILLGSNSPSPFKRRTGPLQRSQSAVDPTAEVGYQLGVDITESQKAKPPHGRSRDVRTWEFYCDSDARNALIKTAELDKHGSAQGVLGLIRSSSNIRKPLNPLRKENVPLHRTDDMLGKTSKGRVARTSKLERAASSMGRLQGSQLARASLEEKPSKEGEIWQDNFGDSDKENEDPDRSAVRRRTSNPTTRESPRRGHRTGLGKRGEEVGGSMGKAAAGEVRADVELDAVQQLLSLSQGAWR